MTAKPLPAPDADTHAFWEGLREGKLLLQRCRDCGHVQYYQQATCRDCQSAQLEHQPASGRGVVYSYSVVHRAPGPEFKDDVPYCVLLVELDEGPRMIASLAKDVDQESVDFDTRVVLEVEQVAEKVWLPRFRPV